jgi:hypothetical protein
MKLKTYKVRLNCVGFRDVCVMATSKEAAKKEAIRHSRNCDQPGFEFGGFLELESGDEPVNSNPL